VAIGASSVREIDRLNIYHASVLAIRRAIRRLPVTPDHVVVDGNPIRTLGIEHTAVVGGDACCHSIACASIVAKVTRDRLMRALARRHPHYRWETNVGYGTRDHHAGLAAHGITPHHRRSFTPVQLSLALSVAPPEEAAELAQALHDLVDEAASLLPSMPDVHDDVRPVSDMLLGTSSSPDLSDLSDLGRRDPAQPEIDA
jgi:ribonuclease HII